MSLILYRADLNEVVEYILTLDEQHNWASVLDGMGYQTGSLQSWLNHGYEVIGEL